MRGYDREAHIQELMKASNMSRYQAKAATFAIAYGASPTTITKVLEDMNTKRGTEVVIVDGELPKIRFAAEHALQYGIDVRYAHTVKIKAAYAYNTMHKHDVRVSNHRIRIAKRYRCKNRG